jgi:hypothetical protein
MASKGGKCEKVETFHVADSNPWWSGKSGPADKLFLSFPGEGLHDER